jgi:hypothetical protein
MPKIVVMLIHRDGSRRLTGESPAFTVALIRDFLGQRLREPTTKEERVN